LTVSKFYAKTATPATATNVAFEVMIGHNSRMDFAKELVKTTSDSEDSNRSDELGIFAFKIF